MADNKADLILHPVRMRIIQALVGGRKLTRQQLSGMLPDIPQATMYRHLNKLESAGLIVVTGTLKLRGATEKTYAIAENGASIPEEELAAMDAEGHMALFMKFLSGLIGDYGRYLRQDDIDLVRDGISMRHLPLYLSRDELMETLREIRAILQRKMENGPAPERTKRTFTTIIIPEPRTPNHHEEE